MAENSQNIDFQTQVPKQKLIYVKFPIQECITCPLVRMSIFSQFLPVLAGGKKWLKTAKILIFRPNFYREN